MIETEAVPQVGVPSIYSGGSMTVERIIDKYGVGRTTLYRYMRAGTLLFAQVGDKRLIPVAAVEAWLESQTANPRGK